MQNWLTAACPSLWQPSMTASQDGVNMTGSQDGTIDAEGLAAEMRQFAYEIQSRTVGVAHRTRGIVMQVLRVCEHACKRVAMHQTLRSKKCAAATTECRGYPLVIATVASQDHTADTEVGGCSAAHSSCTDCLGTLLATIITTRPVQYTIIQRSQCKFKFRLVLGLRSGYVSLT